MLESEVLQWLNPRSGGRYLDGTAGAAGHSAAILAASSPTGWLCACDRDASAIEAARERLADFAGRFELRHGNFAEAGEWVEPASLDGVLLDLGVSSPQLDHAERGFSFLREGPLDMRMDRRQSLTAEEIVNEWPAAELARIFWELGDERKGRQFARAIERARESGRLATTTELAEVIERVAPRAGKRAHPATKVFQALRLVVNDEIGALRRGLEVMLGLLRPGGRLAAISFHSLEDRVVKAFGRAEALDYTNPGEIDIPELRQPRVPTLRVLTRKAVQPSEAEVAENPRARSAQLRVMEKL